MSQQVAPPADTATDGGGFVISLDFELHWGVCDREDALTNYRDNLLAARDVVPRLLALFDRTGIRATWATVGLLFFESRDELLEHLPDTRPEYANRRLSAYEYLDTVGADEADDPLHFAPSLIEQIDAAPGQELASHTFSHFYCLEKGNSAEAFDADLEAARRAAELRDVELTTLVFPRNQLNPDYLPLLEKYGFQTYRGNPPAWMYQAARQEEQNLARRGLRLLDSYLPLTNPTDGDNPPVQSDSAPANIPATRFLRPYFPTLQGLEEVRFRRIQREMRQAAENGEIYHLWWHPHNFGENTEENLAFLRRILDVRRRLDAEHGMPSLTMAEAAQRKLVAA